MVLIHQLEDWPCVTWDASRLGAPLAAARYRQGRLIGRMEALGFTIRAETVLRTLTEDVLKSSEIGSERLNAFQVRSSIARRLKMDIGGLQQHDRAVEGAVALVLDATQHYDQPLTQERLSRWHSALVRNAPRGKVGPWRHDSQSPSLVLSGPAGRERRHFEAPAPGRLDDEMDRFLDWFNRNATTEPVLKAAQAHLWFATVHPFADGNGRIARAIADMALARSEGIAHRFYSMSARICEERDDYYRILERTQRGALDVTAWMEWFVGCLTRAIEGAQVGMSAVLVRTRYWEKLRDVPLNERQRLVVGRLLEGFEGKLTTSKWAALTKSSQDTALRDIQQLVERGVLVRNLAGGRSTSYALGGVESH